MPLVKPITRYRLRLIIPLCGFIIFLVFYLSWPLLIERIVIEPFYKKPPIKVFVAPETVNLTLTNNETVSKRIRLYFDEPVYLIKLQSKTPPNLDQHLYFEYNSTTRTNEHFFYIIINGSRFIFPQGEYEGVIRPYYSVDQNGTLINIAIPLNIAILKKTN